MSLRKYEYYPASPGSIRGAANQARGHAGSLSGVLERVSGEHRAAVNVSEGVIVGSMSTATQGPVNYASAVNRKAIWSAAQLESFADAIEVYNRDSSDPWSIEKLNAKVDMGVQAYFCLAIPGADASQQDVNNYRNLVAQKEGELQSILDGHFQRLDANLDQSASTIAGALGKDPSDADIIAMWKAGNLPAYAALAWPELNLRSIPINGIDENLFDLSKDQLFARLRSKDSALSAAELEWLMVNYPTHMQQFSQEWTIDNAVMLPPGQSPAGYSGPNSHGLILGPDGQWYPVMIPQGPAPSPGGQPSIGSPYGSLYPGTGGWVTLDSRQGPLSVGEEPPEWLIILGGLAGANYKMHGDLSVGENQTDYLTYDQYGNVQAHQQIPDKPPAWGRPPAAPPPELSAAPPGTYDVVEAQRVDPMKNRVDAAGGVLGLTIGGLQGAVTNEQIDANNSYAGNVTFQDNGYGRRAVIQLSQLTYDQSSGEVKSWPRQSYGVINGDGDIDHGR
jgi:hypothetical protein